MKYFQSLKNKVVDTNVLTWKYVYDMLRKGSLYKNLYKKNIHEKNQE